MTGKISRSKYQLLRKEVEDHSSKIVREDMMDLEFEDINLV